MSIYLAVITYIVIGPVIFNSVISNKEQARKYYIISVCTIFTLLTGLRSMEIGADTINYQSSYDLIARTSWENIFSDFLMYIKSGLGILQNNELRDPLYNFFVKVTQIISTDYRFYMFVLGIVINVPLCKWVCENSKKPYISLLVYFVLNYSFLGTTGYRQAIAFSIVVLWGYTFIKERKLVPFLILLGIGFFFHKSVLVFALFYILFEKKITSKYIMCMMTVLVFIAVFRTPFANFWKNISGYGQFYTGQYEGAGTYTFTAMLLLILIVTVMMKDTILKHDPNAERYINALFLAVVFTPLTFINPSAMRIVEYFSIFLALLLPDLLYCLSTNSRKVGSALIVVLLVLLLIKSGQSYAFM